MGLRFITLIGIIVSMVTGIALGILTFLLWPSATDDSGQAHAIQRAVQYIESNYVEPIPDGQLINDALNGMLNGLDDHSKFLDPKAYRRLQADTDGAFGGIGIELGLVAGYFTVTAILAETPAAAAGLAAGDRLVAVDDEPLGGKRIMEVVDLLRGPPGTDVQVALVRSGDTVSVGLTRARIQMQSVDARWLEPGFAYAHIARFQNRTGHDFTQALTDLANGGNSAIQGLVLDLRSNPGGVLGASVDVADALLDRGLLICSEGRPASRRLEHRARTGDLLRGAPVAVLINQSSASGSEIVASALQDHERATLVGGTSYGKGSVQSVLPLAGGALKLSTGYYYRPDGSSIHAGGVLPDVEIDASDGQEWIARALSIVKGEVSTAR